MLGIGFLLAGLHGLPLAAGAPGATRASSLENAVQTSEYAVKANMLGHFLGYTTWPEGTFESESSPIRLLVLGKDPFGETLDKALGKKTVGKRAIQIERRAALPDKLEAHAIFCGALDPEERNRVLGRVAAQPVLLIGESAGFAQAGACVNFFLEDAHVRFEVNTEALQRARLGLSSEMLKHARLVKTRGR